ncbi:MAG TPA: isoprenylcysteine carboxylmethyltransferase family protein [Solirubrobacteraceae bacterium]|jgi:protein-S-isoprenylcysteine O-methyltransferase Ste14
MNYKEPTPRQRAVVADAASAAAGAMTGATPNRASSADDTAGVIAPPPLIYLGALGIGLGLDTVIGSGSLPSRVAIPAGSALLIAGSGLLGSFARAFLGAETPIDPYTPSTAMVTNGPFRLTRNPAYLGMALTYAGIAIVSNAPWALVPLAVTIAIIDRGVIAREERYLKRKFGAPYTDYKRRVRRWI